MLGKRGPFLFVLDRASGLVSILFLQRPFECQACRKVRSAQVQGGERIQFVKKTQNQYMNAVLLFKLWKL